MKINMFNTQQELHKLGYQAIKNGSGIAICKLPLDIKNPNIITLISEEELENNQGEKTLELIKNKLNV